MPAAARRVASLLPAATEIVCAVGGREALVGVSHECDHPPAVAGLPVLTRSRLAPPGAQRSSGAIERDVRALLEGVLAIYEVELEALRRAAPDLVVTQDLCEVCAVPFADVERAVRTQLPRDVRILSLRPTRLADLWTDLRRVGAALGRSDQAERAVGGLRERVATIAERARGAPTRPAVLTIEWLDPVMVGGTWMPELVELAGGRPLATRPGEPAPTLDRAALAALAPDVVLVKPCGFELERTARELDRLEQLVAAMPWPAARRGDVWVADGQAYFNRPGPRLVESLEILAACLHPQRFEDLAQRHRGSFARLFELERSDPQCGSPPA